MSLQLGRCNNYNEENPLTISCKLLYKKVSFKKFFKIFLSLFFFVTQMYLITSNIIGKVIEENENYFQVGGKKSCSLNHDGPNH